MAQELNQNLDHLKAFIDEEILLILGQDIIIASILPLLSSA